MSNIIKEIPFEASTIETIDMAFYDWLNVDMDIYSTTSEGWKKVPVTWISAERTHQLKSDQDIRDSSGMVKYPIMTVTRASIIKDPSRKGAVPANIRPINDEKGGTLTIGRVINQEKTSNFLNADLKRSVTADQTDLRTNRSPKGSVVTPLFSKQKTSNQNKVVYQTITIPLPIYVVVTYEVNIKTDYQQQLNEISTPFLTRNGNVKYFQISKEQHRYDAFIKEDFNFTNNAVNLNEERKTYGCKISIEVKGYLVGDAANQIGPKAVVRENAVEVKIPRETVIFGDIPDFLNTAKNKTSYRE